MNKSPTSNEPKKAVSSRTHHKRVSRKIDPSIQKEADEIVAKTGIDRKHAIQIALGKTTLQKTLKELMLLEKVNRLVKTQGLPRDQAFAVARGDLPLDEALLLNEMRQSQAWQPEHSFLIDLHRSEKPGFFFIYGHKPFTATVEKLTKYDCWLKKENEDPHELQKHNLLLATSPEIQEELLERMGTDKEVQDLHLDASVNYRNRFRSRKRILFRYHRDASKVKVTLRDGTLLVGRIGWFGKWEFLLEMSETCQVVVFRHAMHKLEVLEKKAPKASEKSKGVSSETRKHNSPPKKGKKKKKKKRH